MTLDLTQFHDAFFEESFEALDSMEAALLRLDIGAPDPELINTIFRVAHSIKGGSATFGFSEIASFTHSLETLLDELRGNRMAVTQSISDLLLKSVDVMREMLRAVQSKQPVDAQRVADLQFDLEVAIVQKSAPAAAAASALAAAAAPPAPAAAAPRRWSIRFRPTLEFFARGNDPVRMLREIAEMGEAEIVLDAEALPPLETLDPQHCHLAWNVSLSADVAADDIRQIFDWVEGDCELEILPDPPQTVLEPQGAVPGTSAVESEIVDVLPVPPAPAAKPAPVPAPQEEPKPAQSVASASEGGTAGSKADPHAVGAIGDTGSIRVSVEKIDELMNTVGELVITQAMLSQIGRSLEGPEFEPLHRGLTQLERHLRELQESVMRVRMLPISFVFSRFPRMVRDLAQRLGKKVELRMTGEHTELDKTVLEKIGDPLVHLVRNSIDHGIERPEARVAAGKPPFGTLHLDACHRGGNIAVEVIDDGGGLDKERILAKARARNLIGPNDVLTDEQAFELIFMPGFSTAEQTTDVSGRGVGLDVVKKNVQELGGKIEVTSELGRGARFVITLPLTLAIVDGQSVAVGGQNYIVPLINIIESLQIKPAMVKRIAGQHELFQFRGEYVPIIRLYEVFNIEPRTRELHEGLVVVVEGDGRRVGIFVDDLLGQQQVVIKSLQTNYGQVEGVSGATILGDGSVALILDLRGIVRRAFLRAAA